MKILVVTHKDGPNLFIENIVKEMIVRKHQIEIYAIYEDDTSIRMFTALNVPIHPIEQLNDKILEMYDCIFCPIQAVRNILEYKKYIFSFCNMNPKFDHVRGADFIFTLSDLTEPNEHVFAYMPVGLPKNDSVRMNTVKQLKSILVVDSGHFPFSQKGKYQVAEMILNICTQFPDYEVKVKPRWLKNMDIKAMTHVNLFHLYDVIDEVATNGLPDNLVLLNEHRDLQELIDESVSVVTLCTTAYLDVALRGKGLIVASGFDNEDMYQVRADYFNRVYQYAEGSGCVVDWKDVCNYLPSGIQCKEEHLNDTFTYRSDVSRKVLEVMEYVNDTILSQGKYPIIAKYDYETYQQDIMFDEKLDFTGLYANRRFYLTESVIALNRSISYKIDWTPFVQQQKKLCQDGAKKLTSLQNEIKKEKYKFIIQEAELLKDNDIDRSFYFSALNYQKKYDVLLSYLDGEESEHPILNYYCGLYWFEKKYFEKAILCLEKYVSDVRGRCFIKYSEEQVAGKRLALVSLLDAYKESGDTEKMTELLRYYCSDSSSTTMNLDINRRVYKVVKNSKKYVKLLGDEELYHQLKEAEKELINKIRVQIWKKIKKVRNLNKLKKKFKKINKYFRKKYTFLKSKIGRLYDKYISYYICSIGNSLGWFDKEQKKILSYKNRYLGKECFVIGNGPSLTTQDLERIKEKGYVCFASNKIYKIYNLTEWRPDYYSCIDGQVFWQNKCDILEQISCDMFLNHRFEKKLKKNIYDKYIDKKENLYFLKYFFRKNKIKFYPDSRMILSGGTVTFVLISLAWTMGFRTIYLIGCDHNYNSFDNKKTCSEIVATKTSSTDYFCENYMKPREKMIVGDLEKAEKGFLTAKAYIDSHGGHLYNATRGGKLEVLERKDLDEILN